jgi:hypothetical protein
MQQSNFILCLLSFLPVRVIIFYQFLSAEPIRTPKSTRGVHVAGVQIPFTGML